MACDFEFRMSVDKVALTNWFYSQSKAVIGVSSDARAKRWCHPEPLSYISVFLSKSTRTIRACEIIDRACGILKK